MSSGTLPSISEGGASGSPSGSPPAPDRAKTVAGTTSTSLIEGMTISFVHAYTLPGTVPRLGAGVFRSRAGVVPGATTPFGGTQREASTAFGPGSCQGFGSSHGAGRDHLEGS